MKMVTEPPRSNQKRSATPAAGSPRRAASGAQPQPGARKRNPAVKPTTPRQGKVGQRVARPNARSAQQPGAAQPVRGAKPAGVKAASARAKAAVQGAKQPRPAQTTGSKAAARRPASKSPVESSAIINRGKNGIKKAFASLQPTASMRWLREQVGTTKQPNWRGIAMVALAVLAVLMLLYGGIIQSRKVSQAQQLEGYQARVITAVVVSHGLGGTKVDINGENVSVAQMDEPVPVGEPLRVRINPNSPGYVVDARIEPDDAIARAKRNRLFAMLIALIVGAAAVYLVITGRGNR